jgi:hypothetical protein
MDIDYNKIIKKKAIIIWYWPAMRGNSVYRILSAHPEVYWNYKLQQSSHEILQHPLDLPESVAGFNSPDASKNVTGRIENINYLQFAYTTYHTTGRIDIDNVNTYKAIKAWIASKSYLDKKLFVMSHPAEMYKDSSLLTLDDKPHIWLYGTIDRLGVAKHYINLSYNSLAYNLNVDALYSTDYTTFETEYYKLIAHFNFTSCINRVRAFILLTLERETYISKFY